MKFLIDENLSYKLVKNLKEIFPEILQLWQLKINQYDDRQIW